MDFDRLAKGDWVKRYSITFEQYDKLSYVHPVLVLDDQRVVKIGRAHV